MHLLYPQAKGGLAPSLLLLWESQGTLGSFLAGFRGVPAFGGVGWGGEEEPSADSLGGAVHAGSRAGPAWG